MYIAVHKLHIKNFQQKEVFIFENLLPHISWESDLNSPFKNNSPHKSYGGCLIFWIFLPPILIKMSWKIFSPTFWSFRIANVSFLVIDHFLDEKRVEKKKWWKFAFFFLFNDQILTNTKTFKILFCIFNETRKLVHNILFDKF